MGQFYRLIDIRAALHNVICQRPYKILFLSADIHSARIEAVKLLDLICFYQSSCLDKKNALSDRFLVVSFHRNAVMVS